MAALLVIVALALSGCGRRSGFAELSQRAAPTAGTEGLLSVQQAQAELAGLYPPEAVDFTLMAYLKDFLAAELERCEVGKVAATPPQGELGAVADLAVAEYTAGTMTLTRTYRNAAITTRTGWWAAMTSRRAAGAAGVLP